MKKHNKTVDLILYILSAEVIGMSSGLLAGSFEDFFEKYREPPLLPPSWLFPVVWIILYALMGISAHIVHYSHVNLDKKRKLLAVYWTQLIILLLILIAIMVYCFGKVNRTAAYLNIPYFFWVAFATYLNIATIIVNL